MATTVIHNSRTRRIVALGGAGLVLAATVGCVSQQQYDELNATNEALGARIADLNSELETTRDISERRQQTIADLQEELSRIRARMRDAAGDTAESVAELRARYERLLERLNTMPVGGTLDAETEAALRELAANNPQLFSFDADRGVLRVASDLTFASGSADVQGAAEQGLSELADILEGVIGVEYDLRVVGHTDSQRMSNQATIRRFGDNRGLSMARASAVARVLIANGLPADRLQTAGWGPHRPLVPNNPRGGTPANRRVEIFVVPSTLGESMAPTGTVETAPAPARSNESGDFPVK